MNEQLLADGAIARALSISPVTIRKQRFDRRHGRPHWFTVDPVMIGSVPRCRASEVLAWIQAQTDGRACGISTSGGAQ